MTEIKEYGLLNRFIYDLLEMIVDDEMDLTKEEIIAVLRDTQRFLYSDE